MMDPSLESYVAGRQSNNAQVFRQARMMREEREAAHKALNHNNDKNDKKNAGE